jgi:MFS family permease
MKPLHVLFCIVIADLLGFGIIIPLFPYIAVRLGATPERITPLLAVYSACQFIAAPLWGRLSDRFGRRPILMSSMFGAALSYVMLAFGTSMSWLLASRILGGAMAGNIAAAFAYAADVTVNENRAKGLGLVGAAIAIGFMLGPALGGVLAGPHPQAANFTLPALVAAASSSLGLLAVWLWLPESHTPDNRARHAPVPRRRIAWDVIATRPILARLIGAVLLITIAQSILESIVAIWAMDQLGFGPRPVGLYLLLLGALVVAMQGGAAGQLTRRFGEKAVAVTGVVVYIAGLVALAAARDLPLLLLGGILVGLGTGAYQPSLSSLASKQAGANERGLVMGTYQSATSLARIIGPSISGALYASIAFNAPFLAGVAVTLPALVLIAGAQPRAGS